MRDFMPGSGFRLGPGLSHSQQQDVLFGEKIARETSRLEIGQTVVVKDGTILAVEALEGTNICLERGGSLAGRDGGAVAVKLAKPGHDMRFDIPCLGPATIETCIKSGIRVLAFEARRSILLEQEKCADLANRGKVSVVTFG
jgi:DUF1009 family protein